MIGRALAEGDATDATHMEVLTLFRRVKMPLGRAAIADRNLVFFPGVIECRNFHNEAELRAVMDASELLMWIAGIDKLCTHFNAAWLGYTGRRMAEELGNGWAAGVHPEDLPGCLQGFFDAFDQRRVFRLVYRLRRADGEYGWLVDQGIPWYRSNGDFAGYVGSAVEVAAL